MKFKKAKRFNTVESYAVCACPMALCSCGGCTCSCGDSKVYQSNLDSTSTRNWQSSYDRNRYDTATLSI
ncbi:hypothetical protein CIW83_09235 [Tissierella sp. P1]|uniref:hypothetical protein n=1 Tax=Tissierella sp. P1 TaxID=1280483 RepID=UPI000BA09164|nr:hypothetical protein [Tissierella sp. P1]OZV12548.1 hypothetical protein CIW83_09235 [Tissierella sp. P1]